MNTVKHETLIDALSAIQGEIGAVGKDGKAHASMGGYSFRGIDAVMNALHPLLAKHGVVIAPTIVDHQLTPFAGYSKPHTITILTIDYNVHGPNGEKLDPPVRAIGYGIDNTDKGPGKAQSYAFKSAIGQLFSLPTDDPEMDNEQTPEPQHLIPDAAVNELLKLKSQMSEQALAEFTDRLQTKLGATYDRQGLSNIAAHIGEQVLAQARKAAHDPNEEIEAMLATLSGEQTAAFDSWRKAQKIPRLDAKSHTDKNRVDCFSWLKATLGEEQPVEQETEQENKA